MSPECNKPFEGAVAIDSGSGTEGSADVPGRNFELFFDLVDDLLFVLDSQGRILKANRSAYRKLGYSEGELLRMSVAKVHPPDRQEEVALVVQAMLSGELDVCTIPVSTKTGRRIPVETRIAFGEWDGKPALFGVTRDVSAIRQSEQKFSQIFQSSPLLIALSTSQSGIFLDVNDTFLEVLGYERSEVVGKTARDLELFETFESRASALRKLRETGLLHNHEVRVRRKSGEVRDGLFSVTPLKIADEDCLLSIMLDVTERKAAQNALVESEERLALALAGADLGTWDWLIETGDAVFNRRWAEMLGHSLDEIEPHIRAWERLVHPDDRAAVSSALHRHLSGLDPFYESEYRLRHKSGNWIWVHDRGKVIRRDDSGRPLRAAGTHRDITLRKQTEQELLDSEARFRSIVESVPEAILILDAGFRVRDANQSACLLAGRTYDFLVGRSILEIVVPESAPRLRRRLLKPDTPGSTLEVVWNRGDHSEIPVDLSVTRMTVKGTPGLIVVARDATARKSAEEQRLEFERRMLDAQKLESLGVLAGGIAHDFNNLLTAIQGNAELAQMTLPHLAPAWEYLEEIERASQKAATLTSQMLAYSGKGNFIVEQVDLNEQIKAVSHLLAATLPSSVGVRCELTHPLPQIEGDPIQIRQMIMNLVTNASEALCDRVGEVRLSTSAVRCDRPLLDSFGAAPQPLLPGVLVEGEYVLLEVADNGCGMTEEVRNRAFEPFFSTKFTGRGLGLSAVLGIVRGHRGAISLESTAGSGTVVRIILPEAMPESEGERTVAGGSEAAGSRR